MYMPILCSGRSSDLVARFDLAMLTAFHDPVFFTLTCTALGLIVGSFLNVVILRLPKMMEQSWRRECCELLEQPLPDDPLRHLPPGLSVPGCGTPIKPWQNIPVISWLVCGGNVRSAV